jgi:AcrR family transcriptional regulator
MTDQIATRRRGAALEDAILDAAWAELSTKGYSNFTYEAVAKRAGTSRPVLYRRWETRIGLAAAALARYAALNPMVTPDLGDLREELLLVLRRFADRSPPAIMRVFTQLWFDMNEEMGAEQAGAARDRLRQDPLKQVIERAIRRGEVDPQRVTPRVLGAPLGLILHEIVITARPITDEAIAEIVDQIVLPILTPAAAASPAQK